MSHSHNFTMTSAVTSVVTTEQSAVILNNVHYQVLYWLCKIQWRSMGLCHGLWSLIRRMQRPNRMADF